MNTHMSNTQIDSKEENEISTHDEHISDVIDDLIQEEEEDDKLTDEYVDEIVTKVSEEYLMNIKCNIEDDLNQLHKFDSDVDKTSFNAEFKNIINKYKDVLEILFSKAMWEYDLSVDNIHDFQSAGFDINKQSDAYLNDAHAKTTPLASACEWRKYTLMENLLICAADPNYTDTANFNCLDSTLIGHNPDYSYDYESCEKCVKLLEKYNVKKIIHKLTRKEFCAIFMKKSNYLKKFITDCFLI